MPGYLIARAEPPDYAVIDADAEAAHALGITLPEIEGATLLAVIDASGAFGPLRETIRGAVRSNEACNALLRFVVDERVVERQIAVVPSSHGGESQTRMTLAAQIEEAPPRIGAIVDVISHELRSPLNAALIWATLLELDHAPATVEKAGAIIRESVRTQARLIDDLVDVSRVDAHASPVDPQPIDLGELLVLAIADARGYLAPAVAVDTVAPNTPQPVSGDAGRLQRVIHHLVRNAANAMPDGGTVVATLVRHEHDVVIDVTDRGVGMSAAQISQTFRPFWRADRRHSGAGLGLGVVRTIVAQHGGCVCARSAGPGLGSTFTFTLPIRRD